MLLNNNYINNKFEFINESIKENHNKNDLLNDIVNESVDDYPDKYFTDNKDGILTPEERKNKERITKVFDQYRTLSEDDKVFNVYIPRKFARGEEKSPSISFDELYKKNAETSNDDAYLLYIIEQRGTALNRNGIFLLVSLPSGGTCKMFLYPDSGIMFEDEKKAKKEFDTLDLFLIKAFCLLNEKDIKDASVEHTKYLARRVDLEYLREIAYEFSIHECNGLKRIRQGRRVVKDNEFYADGIQNKKLNYFDINYDLLDSDAVRDLIESRKREAELKAQRRKEEIRKRIMNYYSRKGIYYRTISEPYSKHGQLMREMNEIWNTISFI